MALALATELASFMQRDVDQVTADLVLDISSATVEEFLGRKILAATYTKIFAADHIGSITLPNTPVTAVTLVEIVDNVEGVNTFTVAEGWWVENNRIFGLYDCWEYRVTYAAGYVTVPTLIKGVVLMLASRMYGSNASGPFGATSVTLGDWSVRFNDEVTPDALTKGEMKTLRRFRRQAAGYGTLEVEHDINWAMRLVV